MKALANILTYLPLALILFLFPPYVLSQELNAKEVVKRADDNMRGKTSQAEITIQIVRPAWNREMKVKAWTKGDDYTMILVRMPAKEKGIAFLKREKEVWHWIPAIERTIKLPPSMMSQSWMGTDFTNDDLVKEASSVEDYEHRHIGKEAIQGKDCYKIEMIPKPSAAIVWEKVIVWIDTLDFLQLKTEFYDEDGELINVMHAGDIKKFGSRKVTSRLEMIPTDKTGYKTIIIYDHLEYDAEIPDHFFTTRNMIQLE